MPTITRKIAVFCLSSLLIFALSCGENSENSQSAEKDTTDILSPKSELNVDENISEGENEIRSSDAEKKENVLVKTKYICPLGDKEGNAEKAGNCSACGMELIENPDF